MPTYNENGSRRALSLGHPRSAPWTAARCNRTLRQLTTFLAKLERWHKDFNKGQTKPALSRNHDASRHQSPSRRKRKSDLRPSSYEHDPDWVSQSDAQPRKRQRQYNGKHRKDHSENTTSLENAVRLPKTPHVVKHQHGTIPIDTPLIAGTIQSEDDDNFQRKQHRRERSGRRTIFKQRVTLDFEEERDYDSIVQALPNILETFLDTTTQVHIAEQNGARSLLAMCQRKIPDCIMEEQRSYDALKEDDSEEVQVAPQLFSELEDAYSVGAGWTPLRNLVRSYGLRLLCDAIKTRQLSLDTAASTVRQIVDLGHLDALECLSEALLHAAFSDGDIHNRQVNPLKAQRIIDDWLRKDDLFGPIESRNIISCKILAIKRVLNDQPNRLLVHLLSYNTDIVRFSIASLTGGSPASAIGASFLHDFMLQSMDMRYQNIQSEVHSLRLSAAGKAAFSPTQSDTSQNHLHITSLGGSISGDACSQDIHTTATSILTVITSAILIRQKDDISDIGLHSAIHLIKGLMIRIQQQKYLRISSLPIPNATTSFYVLLVNILLRSPTKDPINQGSLFFESDIFDAFSSNTQLLELSTAFILDITHCCGRVSRTDGFPFLQHIISQLTTSLPSTPSSSPFPSKLKLVLHTIASEAALSFAQRHDRPSYYQWASEIQRAFSSVTQDLCLNGDTEPQTPSLSFMARNRKPYRWDESIEEWIAETPFLARERRDPSSQPLQRKNVLSRKRSSENVDLTKGKDSEGMLKKRKRQSAPQPRSQRWVVEEQESEDELSIL
ncbi:MAG: hypothetical protein Q9160_005759 [Pyrenula sp. 1 TL-2023]